MNVDDVLRCQLITFIHSSALQLSLYREYKLNYLKTSSIILKMGGIFSCWFRKDSKVKVSEAKIAPEVKTKTSEISSVELRAPEPSVIRPGTPSISLLDTSTNNTLSPNSKSSTKSTTSKHKTVSGHYSKILVKNGNPDFNLVYSRASINNPVIMHQALNVSFISTATYGTKIDSQICNAIKSKTNLPADLTPIMGFINHVREGKDIRTHQNIGNNLMGANYDVYRDGNIIDIKMSKNDVFSKKQNWAQLLIYASLMIQINPKERLEHISLYDVGKGQMLSVSLQGIDLRRVYESLTIDTSN